MDPQGWFSQGRIPRETFLPRASIPSFYPHWDVIFLLLYQTNPTMVRYQWTQHNISNHYQSLMREKTVCCFGWGQGHRWRTCTFPARRHRQWHRIFYKKLGNIHRAVVTLPGEHNSMEWWISFRQSWLTTFMWGIIKYHISEPTLYGPKTAIAWDM